MRYLIVVPWCVSLSAAVGVLLIDEYVFAAVPQESASSGKVAFLRALESVSESDLGDKTVFANLVSSLQSNDREISYAARQALVRTSKSSLPSLIQRLECGEAAVQIVILETIESMGRKGLASGSSVKKLVASKNGELRRAAIRTLGEIEGASAVSLLIKIAKQDRDPEARLFAIIALSRLGAAARPAVSLLSDIMREELVTGKEHVLGSEAANALAAIGCDGIPSLCAIVEDAGQSVLARSVAISSLGHFDPKAIASVPALLRSLVDPNADIRWWSALALRDIGWNAPIVVDALCRSAGDSVPMVRKEAIRALARIDSKNERVAALLVTSISDGDNTVAETACEVIGELGEAGKTAVPALLKCLEKGQPSLRVAAMRSLGRNGRNATDAVPALARLCHDKNESVAEAARSALRRISDGGR